MNRDNIGVFKKSYKKKLFAGITVATFGAGLIYFQQSVSADTTSLTTNSVVAEEENADVLSTNTSDDSEAESIKQDKNENNLSNNSVEKSASSSVSNATSSDTTNISNDSVNNQGNLDSANISNDQLNVSGWHATNYDVSRPNSFVIVYDSSTNTELARQKIEPTIRTDVQRAYPSLNNAKASGFDVSFKLKEGMTGDKIQIISRYSSDINGNIDYVDYWFDPIIFNDNKGNLDSANFTEDNASVNVSGWHASDLSVGSVKHELILFDKSANKQVSIVDTNSVNRDDVSKIYSNIYGASESGFKAALSLNGVNISDALSVVSRYKSLKNGTISDLWMDLPQHNDINAGYLDYFTLNGNNNLSVGGWHVTNNSVGKETHNVILYDLTTNKQVDSVTIQTAKRDDVAKQYSNVINSNKSGFQAQFDLTANLVGHNLTVVDRYLNSVSGNYIDYWYGVKSFTGSDYSIDSYIKLNSNGTSVQINGWFASFQAVNKKYATVIAIDLDTGNELARQGVELTKRNDVASAHPDLYNSGKSGFSTTLTSDKTFSGRNVKFILRFSADSSANTNYSDIVTTQFNLGGENKGSFDVIKISSNNIYLQGWHAADASYGKKYEYIIAVDSSGRELGRKVVSNSRSIRNDVKAAYPNIYDSGNSGNSGFSIDFPLTSNLNNHYVRFIDRFTDDSTGNGSFVDYYSNIVGINISYNINANSINSYIINNGIRHAGIQTQIWSGYPTADMSYRNGVPEGVVVHETATYNDSISGEMNYAQNHYENAFVHSYVSDSQIINVANTDLKCWGSGYYGNQRFVQFETIEVHSKYAFAAEINNAAYYTAYILKEYNLTPSLASGTGGTVWSHHNVSTNLGNTDHTDPDGYWSTNARQFFGSNYSMSDFFELVKYYYAQN